MLSKLHIRIDFNKSLAVKFTVEIAVISFAITFSNELKLYWMQHQM
jgi:hypothetical protein